MPEVDRTPPYLQVRADLQRRIINGDLADGDRVPSVREIASQWQISQATAMKALATLRADGLVESVTGVGTVVRSRKLYRTAADRLLRALTTGKIYPEDEYAVITAAEITNAPTWVADLFDAEEGVQAVRRQRVTYNSDGPVSASTSWFTADLAESVPALLEKERIPGGTPNAIESETGRRADSVDEASAASSADSEQAEWLGVSPGDPVLLGRNVYYDAEGAVIEAGESVTPQDRWRVHRGR